MKEDLKTDFWAHSFLQCSSYKQQLTPDTITNHQLSLIKRDHRNYSPISENIVWNIIQNMIQTSNRKLQKYIIQKMNIAKRKVQNKIELMLTKFE